MMRPNTGYRLSKRILIKRILILLIGALLLTIYEAFAQGEIWGLTDVRLFKTDAANPTSATNLIAFESATGMYGGDKLTLAGNGKLYGTTAGGGAFDYGVIFEYDPATGIYTKKHDFDGDADGVVARILTLAGNGKLYGLTTSGGANGMGTIFEYDPATGTFEKKHDFSPLIIGSTGSAPDCSLTLAPNGKLYGFTARGGTADMGVLFEYDPATNAYAKKIDFNGTNGSYPSAELIAADNNMLYAAINNGGDNGLGVILEYDPATNNLTIKHHFDDDGSGSVPMPFLTLGPNGKLYGTTSYQINPSFDDGVLFEYDYVNDVYTNKHNFGLVANDGRTGYGMVLADNNKLYGITLEGGTNDKGTLYEFDPATDAYSVKINFNTVNGMPISAPLYVRTQSITFGVLPAKTILDPAFVLTATGGASGNAVAFTSSDPSVATVSGHTVTITGIGTTIITASQTGNGTYLSAPNVSQTLTVSKATQSITFGTLTPKSFGNAPFDLTSTASSGLAVTYASSNPAVATVTDNTVTVIGPGSTVITASQAGNATYHAAIPVTRTLTVNKADQTITFGPLADGYFGDFPFALTASSSSSLVVTFTSSNTDVATISGNTLTMVGAGTTTITALQGGDVNYNAAPAIHQTLVVHIGGQEITFGALPSKTFGDAPFALTATASSGLPVSYYSDDENIATLSGNIVTIVGAGTTTITAWQEGNANYDAANNVTQTLSVDKGTQTITFAGLAENTFGDSPVSLTATSTSGLPVSYGSSNTSVATVSGNMLSIVGAGTTTITARQSGNANYFEAGEVTQTLTVNKATQVITFNLLPDKMMGDPSFDLAATASSGLPVHYESDNPVVATITGNTLTLTGAGTAVITASQQGNENYLPAPAVTRPVSVLKRTQAITFAPLTDKVVGDPAFQLTASATSTLPVNYTSNNTSVAMVSGNVVTIVGAGVVVITATQPGNGTYNAATAVQRTLTIVKKFQGITFPGPGDKTIGDSPFDLTASSISGLTIDFTSPSDKVSLAGRRVTLLKPGRASITAIQGGNAEFQAAAPVTSSFCINPAKPAITVSDADAHAATLMSSASEGNQWFLDGTAITNATGNTYSVSVPGVYRVRTRVDDCFSAFSDDLTMIITGISNTIDDRSISIFPNPASEWLTVSFDGIAGEKHLAIFQSNGQQIASGEAEGAEWKLSTKDFGHGFYLIQVRTEKIIRTIRFQKN